jgi:hypothetical protein
MFDAGDVQPLRGNESMRKLIVATTVLFLAGSLAWQAEAQTLRGPGGVDPAQNYTPIEKAACQGWGRWCRPGWVRVCGPFHCWCRPCR